MVRGRGQCGAQLLFEGGGSGGAGVLVGLAVVLLGDGEQAVGGNERAGGPARALDPDGGDGASGLQLVQIGRASCRERV